MADKRWYTIAASTGPVDGFSDELVEHLSVALAKAKTISGTVASGDSLTRHVSMRGSVEAPTFGQAIELGLQALQPALGTIGRPPIVDFRVLEDLAEDEFASARDDVVGTPEVAARLGISRQRVAQLVEQPGRFPTPIATVRGTHLWEWGDVADWIAAGARDMRRKQATIEELRQRMEIASKQTRAHLAELQAAAKKTARR